MQPGNTNTQADKQIATSTLRVESKVFFIDVKENARGKYVKISERTSTRERSTIVVPAAGVQWFTALITYYVTGSGDQQALVSKQLQVESKAFFFECGENTRGKYLRISESGPGTKGRSSLIIPAGGVSCAAWENLRDSLDRMEAFYLQNKPFPAQEPLPLQALDEPSAVLHQSQDPSQLDVAGSQQLVGPGPSPPSIGETKTGGQVLRAGHKRFFFDLGSNQKGDFLRITEAVGNDRISIMIPGAALEQFSVVVQNAAVQQKNADKPMTSLNKVCKSRLPSEK